MKSSNFERMSAVELRERLADVFRLATDEGQGFVAVKYAGKSRQEREIVVVSREVFDRLTAIPDRPRKRQRKPAGAGKR